MQPHQRRTIRRTKPWIGRWLREKREEAGVDLDEVARALKRNKSTASRIETGKAKISADELPSVLRSYGLTIEQWADQARSRAA